jgi:hypothetical protein
LGVNTCWVFTEWKKDNDSLIRLSICCGGLEPRDGSTGVALRSMSFSITSTHCSSGLFAGRVIVGPRSFWTCSGSSVRASRHCNTLLPAWRQASGTASSRSRARTAIWSRWTRRASPEATHHTTTCGASTGRYLRYRSSSTQPSTPKGRSLSPPRCAYAPRTTCETQGHCSDEASPA